MNWQSIWNSISSACISIAFKLLGAILVFVIGKAIIKFIIKHFPTGTGKHPIDPTASNFIKNIVKTALYVVLAVMIVGILGVPMASVIAVVGSAGAAIALALQGSLANFASGIMILIMKPFKIGDYIDSASASGTVSDLGIFYTTLVTPDNKHISVPNSILTTSTVTNYSCESTRRLDLSFKVNYGSDIEAVKSTLIGIASKHGKVLTDPAPFVRISDINAPTVDIVVRVWCNSADYWDVSFDLKEQMKNAIDENGFAVRAPKMFVEKL